MKAGRNSGAISGSSNSIETEVCSPTFLNLFPRYHNRVAKILRLHVFESRFGQPVLHFLRHVASAGICIHRHVDREERGGNRTCPLFPEKELLDSDPACGSALCTTFSGGSSFLMPIISAAVYILPLSFSHPSVESCLLPVILPQEQTWSQPA
jgi:hypothetical protein